MRQRLRLHRDLPLDGDTDIPVTFRFPTAMAAARKRLVAGVVSVPPAPEAPVRPRHAARTSVLARIDTDAGRGAPRPATPTDLLLRQVESTLDEMQDKIDLLNEDVDQVFKFPAPFDDDWPRAA